MGVAWWNVALRPRGWPASSVDQKLTRRRAGGIATYTAPIPTTTSDTNEYAQSQVGLWK